MRILNIVGALNGACALIILAVSMHLWRGHLGEHAFESIRMAAFLQLASGAAALALARRTDRLSLISGCMIGAGAALFAAAIYGGGVSGNEVFYYGAPVGGLLQIAGWIVLVFANPRT